MSANAGEPVSAATDGLRALGAPAEASRVYAALAGGGPSTADKLHEQLDLSHDVVATAIESLTRLGLVTIENEQIFAVTPRTPLEDLARDHTRMADHARTTAERLGQLWSLHQGRADYLEVLPTLTAARRVQTRVLAESESEVRALSIGSERKPQMAEGLADTLERGVTVRSIYGAEVLAHPAALDVVQQSVRLGEQSRVFPAVPMNLLISDDSYALIVVRVDADRRADGVVIHASDLFDTVAGVFEAFWRLAVPVSVSTSANRMEKDDPETQRLLTNLAAGLTDKAIASDLDVSERTVRRRISQLQELLGAQTRFQLGMQASRHGWL